MKSDPKEKIIFIHSLFRSGSTYLFEKFREMGGFYCYYEPFHHQLEFLKKDKIDIWPVGRKQARKSNHPVLSRPHFFEYYNTFNKEERVAYFKRKFAYVEFMKVKSHVELKKYIDNLISCCSNGGIPLFQFNRSSLRIKWFKEQYPTSLNLYLLRSPRDQFESYVQRNVLKNNGFLAMNILILVHAKNNILFSNIFPNFYKYIKDRNDFSIEECQKIASKIKLESHYKLFFLLWILSYSEAITHCKHIIDVNLFEESIRNIELLEKVNRGYEKFFKNFKIKQYTQYCLSNTKLLMIEQEVINLLKEPFTEWKNGHIEIIEDRIRSYHVGELSHTCGIHLFDQFRDKVRGRLN